VSASMVVDRMLWCPACEAHTIWSQGCGTLPAEWSIGSKDECRGGHRIWIGGTNEHAPEPMLVYDRPMEKD
jgi:hypothetical protein